jgi:hypothetical protein
MSEKVKKPAFTPGPWELHPLVGNFIRPRDHRGPVIADASGENWEANAHLIAAAPDLYEALAGVVELYVELVNSGDAGFWDPEEVSAIVAARAALRKANGGE